MGAVRLLLVDDEETLLDLLGKYLERLGYEVHTCSSAAAALERFDSDPKGYALVLTDLTLPGMKGDAMLEQMRTLNPSLRAILTSGYPYVPQSDYVSFLQKPFLPKVLAEEIRQRLALPEVRSQKSEDRRKADGDSDS
jgi:DNA-binding NtrC family response regulator